LALDKIEDAAPGVGLVVEPGAVLDVDTAPRGPDGRPWLSRMSARRMTSTGTPPVTKLDFMEYGVSARLVAAAIREAQALGFFLTFARGRDSRANPPTDTWRKIKTMEEAEAIAKIARANKDPRAVQFAQQRVEKTKSQYHKVVPVPDSLSAPENRNSPDPLSRSTASPT
jgi:hypothetical protein